MTDLAEAKSIKGLLLDAQWTLDELLGALSHDGLTIADARLAAIGAAVERLDGDWTIRHFMVIRPPGDGPYEHVYRVEEEVYVGHWEEPEPPRTGEAATIPEAVAAMREDLR